MAESSESGKDVKSPNFFERAKEEFEAIIHRKDKTHHKETHGTSDDIDEDTPIDKVKAPGIFERAKEEIEALVDAIHPKKETPYQSPKGKEGGGGGGGGGCWGCIGRTIEQVCSPSGGGKKD